MNQKLFVQARSKWPRMNPVELQSLLYSHFMLSKFDMFFLSDWWEWSCGGHHELKCGSVCWSLILVWLLWALTLCSGLFCCDVDTCHLVIVLHFNHYGWYDMFHSTNVFIYFFIKSTEIRWPITSISHQCVNPVLKCPLDGTNYWLRIWWYLNDDWTVYLSN